MSEHPEPRFVADAMLGRLARWLRVLGYDTTYDPGLDDPALVALAAAEGRTLLTRDRRLIRDLRPSRAVLIAATAPLDQLAEVLQALRLGTTGELFTRCLLCNTPLRAATPPEAESLLPEKARTLPGPVRRCPGCERMYWPGSHTRRMIAALARVLPTPAS